jgi:hypothetical protein
MTSVIKVSRNCNGGLEYIHEDSGSTRGYGVYAEVSSEKLKEYLFIMQEFSRMSEELEQIEEGWDIYD